MKQHCPVDIYVETVVGIDDAYNRAVLELPTLNIRHEFGTPHEFFTFQLNFATGCHEAWPECEVFGAAIQQARMGLEMFGPEAQWRSA